MLIGELPTNFFATLLSDMFFSNVGTVGLAALAFTLSHIPGPLGKLELRRLTVHQGGVPFPLLNACMPPVRKLSSVLSGPQLLTAPGAISGPTVVFLPHLLDHLLPGVSKVYLLMLLEHLQMSSSQ